MSTILEIKDVEQSFRGGFWLQKSKILHGISFSVPEGAIYGFVGANGAGKTTLIHLIVGLRSPTHGSIRLLGSQAISKDARSHLGYLPERPYFYSHLNAEQTLRYFGTLSGLNRREIADRIPRVLKTVGLSDFRKLDLQNYSKGMLQRIGIAQALIHDPRLLVLDEPMSGLDPLGRKEIRDLICTLAKEGRTVFFSSHIIPDVENICDHIALIQKGRLMGAGPIQEFLQKGSIETFFGKSLLGEGIVGEHMKKGKSS